jgi:hypothetical protein
VAGDADFDVRARSPLARLVEWFGPPREYVLARWLILRLLGVVFVFAFLGIVLQGPALLGSHGLTPLATYMDRLREADQTFWDVPSVFWLDSSDAALGIWAVLGLVLSVCLLAGYANLPSLLVLWAIYGSFARVGQLWFGFGWEIQLLETSLVAAFLVHPWDPRPLRARPPPIVAIVLVRWLVFRIMLGAGLIKLRGSACWSELTCLDAHFETQPIPNPLSAWFHHLPQWVLAAGVFANHAIEVALPWFVFGPRLMRLLAGIAMAGFQLVLIASGNLAFLNWLTLVPILALFDDDFLRRLLPRRLRTWIQARLATPVPRDGKQLAIAFGASVVAILLWGPLFGWAATSLQVLLALACTIGLAALASHFRTAMVSRGNRLDWHQLAVGCFAALVALKSLDVVANLASDDQAMNRSYDRLALVNTYGAFGSVTLARHELVIEGTLDPDPATATWHAYELPCKPGDLERRPCILGPYHRRLDWLIWFAAMSNHPGDPWIFHLVWKLLDGDRSIRQLLAVDPFDGARPRWVRIRRFAYHLQPYDAPTWWTRDREQLWLQPLALDTPGFREALAHRRWPSPSL